MGCELGARPAEFGLLEVFAARRPDTGRGDHQLILEQRQDPSGVDSWGPTRVRSSRVYNSTSTPGTV